MKTTDAETLRQIGLKDATKILGLVLLAYYGIKILRSLWVGLTGPLSKVPGPFLNRFTGWAWIITVLRGKSSAYCIEYPKRYGDVIRVAPDHVLVSNKEAIHQIILEKDLRKSVVYEKFRQDRDVATIFTILDKSEYRTRRRLLSQGFSVSYIKGLEPLMLNCIRDLEEVIDERIKTAGRKQTEIDVWQLLGSLTSDIMSETSFGGSFKLVKNGDHPIRRRIADNVKRNALYQTMPWLRKIPFAPAHHDPELKRLINEIIARRRAVDEKMAKPDILQLLLDTHDQNPDEFSDRSLIAEMLLFMMAGSETTASTLIFTFTYLMDDPATYARLVEEVREVFPYADSLVTNEQTVNMPFLNAVLKETLRLRAPAASGLWRQTDEDIILAGFVLPAGTRITANTTPLHLNESEWPDAEEFVPDRWLSEYKGVTAAEKTAWYPFSAGSRNCLGKQFAWNELRLVLASILRRYDLFPIEGQSLEMIDLLVLHLKSRKFMVGVRPRA
ncbi:p450 monooxygenase [Colletotrichum karsti]|uniref:P450 monooxygenase n=1 Tax=Colletotrichum karsti TaxID=1095194 RepID=A0A9P6I4E0_9PEZI|nr:p450 monooxygenase [Colletotrichum karsti]KAF9876732.1 p450 monooxygenase [Colletotrichum karsti]